MNRFLFAAAALALGLSACAPAIPTIDPAQIQASAMAAAGTMIAATQQAMPTSTPVPPTDVPSPTPLPSPTLGVLPTLQALPSPTTASSGSGGCQHPFDMSKSGPKAPVLINNDTKGPITFTLYMSTPNSFGQCGYLSWVIGKGQSTMVSVPYARVNQGDPCYGYSAIVNNPPSMPSNYPFCPNNPDKWTFDVKNDSIHLTTP